MDVREQANVNIWMRCVLINQNAEAVDLATNHVFAEVMSNVRMLYS